MPTSTIVEELLPGLDEKLAAVPLAELETRGGPALPAFKEAGGAGLLVPKQHGGLGADPVTAVRVQRQLAGRSPSLAVAVMMHHLSVATFAEFLQRYYPPDAFEWALLAMVAEQRMLVASASAEGRSGQSVLAPTMRARRDGENFLVNGSKKPCSLSSSADMLTASVLVEGDEKHDGCVAMAIVMANTPGIERREFWTSPVLAGAESDEVVLTDVVVPEAFMVFTDQRPGDRMDEIQMRGWYWFELLAAASYVGIADALVRRVAARSDVDRAELGALFVRLESAMAAVEHVAAEPAGEPGGDVTPADQLARSLLVRYNVQDVALPVAGAAAELAGGLSFIRDPDVAYLLSATRALAYHPPNRRAALPALANYFAGEPFDTTIF